MKIQLYRTILLFLMISLIGCSSNKENIKLEVTPNYKVKTSEFADVPYIDFEDISNIDTKKIDNPSKYYDNTRDLKVNWNESSFYEENEKTKKLFNKITLNEKRIKFPLDFEKLGKEFIGFENINLENIDDKLPINYENSFSKYDLTILNKIPSVYETNVKKYIATIFNERKNLCKLEIAEIDNKTKVAGIITSIHPPFQSQYSLKIDGIGIGNTLNEMYDRLGTPTINSCKENGDKTIFYLYNSEEEKITYFIIFEYSNKSKDRIDIKNNIITDVAVNYSLN